MPEPSIPAEDNASAPTQAPEAADPKTVETDNNLDASKSAEVTSAGDETKSTETKTEETKADTPPSSKLDDDIDDWITSRGAKVPETEAEKLVFQQLRDEQRQFTRERQAAKDAQEFSKAVTEAAPETPEDDDDEIDPLEKRQNKIEAELAAERTTRLQSEFYSTNNVTTEQNQAMLTIFKEKIAAAATPEAKQRAFEVWSSVDALPDLLDLAKARMGSAVQSTVADEAARAEREKIERESNAKSPGRAASKRSSDALTEDQARFERFKARYNKS